MVKDVSREKNLLYQYAKGISQGHLSDKLINQKPGRIDHARWLTLAIRLMVLYTRTEEPSPPLIDIVSFVVQVYCPMWFLIKSKNNFINGPSNIFNQMHLIRTTQSEEVQSIAKKVVERNAFFAEPGMVLTCMLSSENAKIREKSSQDSSEKSKESCSKAPCQTFSGNKKI